LSRGITGFQRRGGRDEKEQRGRGGTKEWIEEQKGKRLSRGSRREKD
jgi:hypothetical protein